MPLLSKKGCFLFIVLLMTSTALAASKTANAYYRDAAFQYIESRLPTAEITCQEGLSYYPNDTRLQMLLDRIQEAKDEQKNQNKDQKQDQNDNKDQDKDQDQKDDKNKDQEKNQNEDQQKDQKQDENDSVQSSSSQLAESSSSVSQSPEEQEPQETPAGQMTPEEAAQLLKDFNEQNGEQKPWRPARGQGRPLKDW